MAVPLLAYGAGLAPHAAIGTAAVSVSLSALFNLVNQARRRNVKWPCALAFSLAGVAGASLGSHLAKLVAGEKLLALFGLMMVAVGILMAVRRDVEGNAAVRLTRETAPRMLPALIGTGTAVGMLAGFFGIGGGFLIVPGLIYATGMPLTIAAGTSLVAVTAFGATTAANYAISGMVDWRIAAEFVAGGIAGGLVGASLGNKLAGRRKILSLLFAALVTATGLYVTSKGLQALTGRAP